MIVYNQLKQVGDGAARMSAAYGEPWQIVNDMTDPTRRIAERRALARVRQAVENGRISLQREEAVVVGNGRVTIVASGDGHHVMMSQEAQYLF